jgi:hypothetical protein
MWNMWLNLTSHNPKPHLNGLTISLIFLFHFAWAGYFAFFMHTGILLELLYISEHNSKFSSDTDNLR